MANPLPGMNPYLEGYRWLGFHGDFCTEAKRQLAPKLRPKYYPFSTRYEVMETDEEEPHYAMQIRDLQNREVVTAIEFSSREPGRKKYLRKRRRILSSAVNLVELDLLHHGQRAPLLDPYPAAPYFVLVNRGEKRHVAEVWPILLEQPLPTVPIPLRDGDPDVPLDLQAVVASVYDRGLYDEMIDYREDPDIRLPPEESAWLDQRLKAAGLR